MKKLLIMIAFLGLIMSACSRTPPVPENGTWVCKELEATVIFGRGANTTSFIRYKGEIIPCSLVIDDGGDWITLVSIKDIPGICRLGEGVFTAKCLSVNSDSLLVKNTGETFIFIRQIDQSGDG